MQRASNYGFHLLLIFVVAAGYPAVPQASSPQAAHSGKNAAAAQPEGDQEDRGEKGPPPSAYGVPEEAPEDELAPAAVELDVSQSSPLIQTLYKATRETKEKPTLDRLDEARKLIESGTDIKATDEKGRTALHWAVFGSSYATKPKVLVAYEEIADALIKGGVDINKEDVYQDTALDYLLYAPTFEMQTLLIENGATSGFLAAFQPLFRQDSDGSMPAPPQQISTGRKVDLIPGATMSVRLD